MPFAMSSRSCLRSLRSHMRSSRPCMRSWFRPTRVSSLLTESLLRLGLGEAHVGEMLTVRCSGRGVLGTRHTYCRVRCGGESRWGGGGE